MTTMEHIVSARVGQIKKTAFDEIVAKIIASIF